MVEVLVVIGILGTLSAILFPAIASAKREGYRAESLANLRTLGHAQELYAGDNAGGYAVTTYNVGGMNWTDRLLPYHPGLAGLKAPLYSPGPVSLPKGKYLSDLGYAMNGCLGSDSDVGEFADLARSAMFAETTSFWNVVAGEFYGRSSLDIYAPDAVYQTYQSIPYGGWQHAEPYGSRKYNGKGAYLFLDGHATIVPETRFFVVPLSVDPLAVCSQSRIKYPKSSDALLFAKEAG